MNVLQLSLHGLFNCIVKILVFVDNQPDNRPLVYYWNFFYDKEPPQGMGQWDQPWGLTTNAYTPPLSMHRDIDSNQP